MPVQAKANILYSVVRKRDKKKRKNDKARERYWKQKEEQLLAFRKKSLREAQNVDELREVQVAARGSGSGGSGRRWVPTTGSAVDVEYNSERTIIGVHADQVPGMLKWLAPVLLRSTRAKLARRGSDKGGAPRGASIILTDARSSSYSP